MTTAILLVIVTTIGREPARMTDRWLSEQHKPDKNCYVSHPHSPAAGMHAMPCEVESRRM